MSKLTDSAKINLLSTLVFVKLQRHFHNKLRATDKQLLTGVDGLLKKEGYSMSAGEKNNYVLLSQEIFIFAIQNKITYEYFSNIIKAGELDEAKNEINSLVISIAIEKGIIDSPKYDAQSSTKDINSAPKKIQSSRLKTNAKDQVSENNIIEQQKGQHYVASNKGKINRAQKIQWPHVLLIFLFPLMLGAAWKYSNQRTDIAEYQFGEGILEPNDVYFQFPICEFAGSFQQSFCKMQSENSGIKLTPSGIKNYKADAEVTFSEDGFSIDSPCWSYHFGIKNLIDYSVVRFTDQALCGTYLVTEDFVVKRSESFQKWYVTGTELIYINSLDFSGSEYKEILPIMFRD